MRNYYLSIICLIAWTNSWAGTAIVINGDTDLANSSYFSGGGTAENPYISKTMAISSTGTAPCMYLSNTTKFITINGITCTQTNDGIILNKVANVTLQNVSISDVQGDIDKGQFGDGKNNTQAVGIAVIASDLVTIGANVTINAIHGVDGNSLTLPANVSGGDAYGVLITQSGTISLTDGLSINDIAAGAGQNSQSSASNGNGFPGGVAYGLRASNVLSIAGQSIGVKNVTGGTGGSAWVGAGIGGNGGDGGIAVGASGELSNTLTLTYPSISNIQGGSGGAGAISSVVGGKGGAGGKGGGATAIHLEQTVDWANIEGGNWSNIYAGAPGAGAVGNVGGGNGGDGQNGAAAYGLYAQTFRGLNVSGNKVVSVAGSSGSAAGIGTMGLSDGGTAGYSGWSGGSYGIHLEDGPKVITIDTPIGLPTAAVMPVPGASVSLNIQGSNISVIGRNLWPVPADTFWGAPGAGGSIGGVALTSGAAGGNGGAGGEAIGIDLFNILVKPGSAFATSNIIQSLYGGYGGAGGEGASAVVEAGAGGNGGAGGRAIGIKIDNDQHLSTTSPPVITANVISNVLAGYGGAGGLAGYYCYFGDCLTPGPGGNGGQGGDAIAIYLPGYAAGSVAADNPNAQGGSAYPGGVGGLLGGIPGQPGQGANFVF